MTMVLIYLPVLLPRPLFYPFSSSTRRSKLRVRYPVLCSLYLQHSPVCPRAVVRRPHLQTGQSCLMPSCATRQIRRQRQDAYFVASEGLKQSEWLGADQQMLRQDFHHLHHRHPLEEENSTRDGRDEESPAMVKETTYSTSKIPRNVTAVARSHLENQSCTLKL